jgi:phosphoribosylglycinamide formyltransferase 2
VAALGLPCVVKPVMSSSGKGQSLVRVDADIDAAWDYAQTGGRAGAGRVHRRRLHRLRLRDHPAHRAPRGGTDFCAPIGHLQRDGDYRESWQPQPMSARRCSVRKTSRGRSPTTSAAGACSAWSCS